MSPQWRGQLREVVALARPLFPGGTQHLLGEIDAVALAAQANPAPAAGLASDPVGKNGRERRIGI